MISSAAMALHDQNVLMWVLAAVPVLILPPTLALFMSLRRKEARAGVPKRQVNFAIVIVAICNIILSALFWRWLSEVSMSSGLSIGFFLKSLGISRPGSPLQSI